ncbi:MAG: hypothetical protein AAGC86_17750 [Pseudomonadota bacterium]
MGAKAWIVAGILALTGSAAQAVSYDWTGNCPATCIEDQAAGTLVLADGYTPDQEITAANFESFTITEPGDTIGFNFTFRNPAFVSGKISENRLTIEESSFGSTFEQMRIGTFLFVYAPDPTLYTFIGDQGSFTPASDPAPVPLPASLPLFALALGAFAAMRWRART